MVSEETDNTKNLMRVEASTHPWERQIGETGLAYKLFSVYRDFGADREIKDVAKAAGRSMQKIRQMSNNNQWDIRVDSYDDYLDVKRQKELQSAILEARIRHHRLGKVILDVAKEGIESLRSMGSLSVKDIILLVESGHKIESIALGLANEITESRVLGDVTVRQTEAIPVEILERIGREIATARSVGEDVTDIISDFEDVKEKKLLIDGKKIPVML